MQDSNHKETKFVLEEYEACLKKKKATIQELQKILSQTEEALQEVKKNYFLSETRRVEMESSTSWKLTKPLRAAMQIIKNAKKRVQTSRGADLPVTIGEYRGMESKLEKRLRDIPELRKIEKNIAIHIHLFYVDLLPEFVDYLRQMPYPFDLYISCPKESNVTAIRHAFDKVRKIGNITVKACENRGRDLAPFYVLFGNELSKYDYILHIHGKKSLFSGEEKIEWRKYSLNTLLGSPALIRKIFYQFEKEESVGLIYPDQPDDISMLAYSWLANEKKGKTFLQTMGISSEQEVFMYPAGSFFWVKTDAIRPMFEREFCLNDFEEEEGQHDGTFAHVLERALPLVVHQQGYAERILDYREGVSREKSLKAFREYLSTSVDELCRRLHSYQTVSFYIFDVLVTKCVTSEEDVEQIRTYRPELTEDELEVALFIPRNDIKRVYEHAQKTGKTVIVIGDGRHDKDQMEKILVHCGFEMPDKIYAGSGDLWGQILKDHVEEPLLHFGSRVKDDWAAAAEKGIPCIWLMNSRDAFLFSPYDKMFEDYKKESADMRLWLGILINGGLFNSPFSSYESIGEISFEHAREMVEEIRAQYPELYLVSNNRT